MRESHLLSVTSRFNFNMDDLAKFNRERWNALVQAGVEYARPFLDLTPESARAWIEGNGKGMLAEVRGKRVLCLANGGGQQTACFGVLGADVTVLDLSDAQLEQDRVAAAHYGYLIRIEHGDMRDLTRFEPASFDIVFHSYSINFVPDPLAVFAQVARVLKPGGDYMVQFSNPHRFSIREEIWQSDTGGYPLTMPYQDGEVTFGDDHWDVETTSGDKQRILGPREFSHTWSRMVNGLAGHGFVIRRLEEWMRREPNAVVGSWEHYTQVMPPYITVWSVYRPDVFA